jgi:hypothetical protein
MNDTKNAGKSETPSWIKLRGLHHAIGPTSLALGTTSNGYAGNELFSNGSSTAKTASFFNGTITMYLAPQQVCLSQGRRCTVVSLALKHKIVYACVHAW